MKEYTNLKIPSEELLYILPEARGVLFEHMINEYKIRFPLMKCIYAALNWDINIKSEYLLIFSCSAENGTSLIRFDMPIQYSRRTTPGYRYCVKNKILHFFFEDAHNNMCTMLASKFYEFIEYIDLSNKKDNIHYWKKPEFSIELFKQLIEHYSNFKGKKITESLLKKN